MNKISISRIASILSVVLIPCNLIIIFGIMIGGGFSSIDSRGFMFWAIVLVFILSCIFTIISWRKIKQVSPHSLLISLLALIFCILPVIITMTLAKYNTQVWELQKIQKSQK